MVVSATELPRIRHRDLNWVEYWSVAVDVSVGSDTLYVLGDTAEDIILFFPFFSALKNEKKLCWQKTNC